MKQLDLFPESPVEIEPKAEEKVEPKAEEKVGTGDADASLGSHYKVVCIRGDNYRSLNDGEIFAVRDADNPYKDNEYLYLMKKEGEQWYRLLGGWWKSRFEKVNNDGTTSPLP